MLDKQCSSVSDPELKEKCFAFVKAHEDYIVTSIIKEVPTIEICHHLRFCALHADDITVVQLPSDNQSSNSFLPECKLCEEIMKKVEKEIERNKSKVIHLIIFFQFRIQSSYFK